MSNRFGMIYKIENKINGKIYIGQTVNNVRRRYGKNLRGVRIQSLKDDIATFGIDAFEITENLDNGDSFEELNALEQKYISLYDSADPQKGYNTNKGGGNHSLTEEIRKKIGDGVRGEKNWMHGKTGELHPNYSRKSTVCDYCGKEYLAMPCKLERAQFHYCSEECRRKSRLHHKTVDSIKQTVKCNCCGKEFKLYPSQIAGKNSLYCSRRCLAEDYKTAMKGENNPNYGNHKVAGESNGRAAKVQCIETGEVFGCGRDADRHFGFRIGSVGAVCRGNQKSTHGYHFQFCD